MWREPIIVTGYGGQSGKCTAATRELGKVVKVYGDLQTYTFNFFSSCCLLRQPNALRSSTIMQTTTAILFASLCTLLLLQHVADTNAAPSREKRALVDPNLTVAVLEELIDDISRDAHANSIQTHKRRLDAGYGSRYGVASSVGSKLMALKQAADWNGPGRKRRQAEPEVEQ